MTTSAFYNRVVFIPTAGGTADFTVLTAAPGARTPATANIPDNTTVSYTAVSFDLLQWETGQGNYNQGVLQRTTIRESSSSNAKVNFSFSPTIQLDYHAQDIVANQGTLSNAANPPSSVDGQIVLFSGATGIQVKAATGTGFVKATAGVYSTQAQIQTSDIALNAVTYALIQQVNASKLLGNPTGVLANTSEIGIDASLSFTGSTLQRSALTGDVTASAGSNATVIATNSLAYSKIQQEAASSILGNPTGAPANVSEITLNATLSFSGTTLQRAALTGDVTASAGSNATTIAANAVTYAKIQQASATTLLGNPTGGAANVSEITLSGGLEFASTLLRNSRLVNAQTGVSYTYVDGDRAKLVTHSNAGAIAGTLPQAGASSQFQSGWFMDVENRGAGTLTITPTTSTIDGAGSLALTTNQGCRVFSDGTNYFTQRGVGSAGGGGTGNMTRRTISGADTVLTTDKGNIIEVTSGTFTEAFTAAATLGNGFWCIIYNHGTGDVTLDPNAAETIDGLTTWVLYPGGAIIVQCDGSAFHSVLLAPMTKQFDANGTFTKPGVGTFARIFAWGGGASGARGRSAATAAGGGGGGGGSFNERTLLLSALGTTETVTIGAGGTAVTTDSTVGNAGGNTTFGSLLTAFGGAGGGAAASAQGSGGGGGGGTTSAGSVGTSTLGGAGGAPNPGVVDSGGTVISILGSITVTAQAPSNDNIYGGGSGAAGNANAVKGGVSSIGGGGGGGGETGATTAGAGGNSLWGGGGGGGGNGSGTAGAGGTSTFGGNGGAGNNGTNAGTAGTQPGGGGGGTSNANSGAGGAGRSIIYIW